MTYFAELLLAVQQRLYHKSEEDSVAATRRMPGPNQRLQTYAKRGSRWR